jgi:hypothetical protein
VNYLQLATWGVGLLAVAYFGWQIAHWQDRAQDAAELQEKLDMAVATADTMRSERDRADAARATSDALLLNAQDRERELYNELKSKVAQAVPDKRDCDLGPGVVSLLNSARGYDGVSRAAKRGGNIPESFTATTDALVDTAGGH